MYIVDQDRSNVVNIGNIKSIALNGKRITADDYTLAAYDTEQRGKEVFEQLLGNAFPPDMIVAKNCNISEDAVNDLAMDHTETDTIWKIWYSKTSTLGPWTNSTQICLLSIMYSRHSSRATKRVAEPQMRLRDLLKPKAADAILRRNTLLRTKRPRSSSILHGLRNTSYSRILQNMSQRAITV